MWMDLDDIMLNEKSQTQYVHLPASEAQGGGHINIDMNSGYNRNDTEKGGRGWVTGSKLYLLKEILCYCFRE